MPPSRPHLIITPTHPSSPTPDIYHNTIFPLNVVMNFVEIPDIVVSGGQG